MARIRFAREYINWNNQDWANYLFTDVSRFSLFGSDRDIPIYRHEGENIREIQNCEGDSVAWDGICFEAHIELTVDRVIRKIFDENVVLFVPFIDDNVVLINICC